MSVASVLGSIGYGAAFAGSCAVGTVGAAFVLMLSTMEDNKQATKVHRFAVGFALPLIGTLGSVLANRIGYLKTGALFRNVALTSLFGTLYPFAER